MTFILTLSDLREGREDTDLIRGSSGGIISRSWVGPFKPMTCREMLGFSLPACEAKGRDVSE